MDSFDRGRLEGRIGFEVVTLLIAEVKLGQAAKVIKVKEIGITEKIATRVEQGVDGGKIAKGDTLLGQKMKAAMELASLRVAQYRVIRRFGDMSILKQYQRHHFYQHAAVKSLISRANGLGIYLKGSTREKGVEHWVIHRHLEDYVWIPRRSPGPLYDLPPTYAEYDQHMAVALRKIFKEEEVQHIIQEARTWRLQQGWTDEMRMPSIPKEMNIGILPLDCD
jgi:hypothetical protein